MKLLSHLALPALAAALLVLSAGDARADMCFGGPRQPVPLPDASQPLPADAGAWNSPLTKQLGSGFLAAAALSTGWLCFRRKGPGAEE